MKGMFGSLFKLRSRMDIKDDPQRNRIKIGDLPKYGLIASFNELTLNDEVSIPFGHLSHTLVKTTWSAQVDHIYTALVHREDWTVYYYYEQDGTTVIAWEK